MIWALLGCGGLLGEETPIALAPIEVSLVEPAAEIRATPPAVSPAVSPAASSDWVRCARCDWSGTWGRGDPEQDAVWERISAEVKGAAGPVPRDTSAIPESPAEFELIERGDPTPGRWWVRWTTEAGALFAARVDPEAVKIWAEPFPAEVARHVGSRRHPLRWEARAWEIVDARKSLPADIRDPHPWVRRAALGTSMGPEAEAAIRAGVRSGDATIRVSAIHASTGSDDPDTRAIVSALACDPVPMVRAAAIFEFGPSWMPEALDPWLVDPDILVASIAAHIASKGKWSQGLSGLFLSFPEDVSRDPFQSPTGAPVCQPEERAWTLDLWSPALATGPVSVELGDAEGRVVGRGVAAAAPSWTSRVTLPVSGLPRTLTMQAGGSTEKVAVSRIRQDAVAGLCADGAPAPRIDDGVATRIWNERAWERDPACALAADSVVPQLPVKVVRAWLEGKDTAGRVGIAAATDRPEILVALLALVDPEAPDAELCRAVLPRVVAEPLADGKRLRACAGADEESRDLLLNAMLTGKRANRSAQVAASLPEGDLARRAARVWLAEGSDAALSVLAPDTHSGGVVAFPEPIDGVAGLLAIREKCLVGPTEDTVLDAVVVLAPDAPTRGDWRGVPLDSAELGRVRTAVCGARVVWEAPRR